MTARSEGPRSSHLGPAGRAALQLLGCCPRMPTSVVTVLLGHRQAATTAQLLARLATRRHGAVSDRAPGPRAGLASASAVVTHGCGAPRIASLAAIVGLPPTRTTRSTANPNAGARPARQRDVPLLVACYHLLAELARGLDGPLRVRAWEHPWVRTVPPTEGSRGRRVRLPAAVGAGQPRG